MSSDNTSTGETIVAGPGGLSWVSEAQKKDDAPLPGKKNNQKAENGSAMSGDDLDNTTTLELDFVVFLNGEMGNHLCQIAAAHAMKWKAASAAMSEIPLTKEKADNDKKKPLPPINLKISYLDQRYSKSKKAESFINKCFPNLRSSNLHEHNNPEYEAIQKHQRDLHGNRFVISESYGENLASEIEERFYAALTSAVEVASEDTNSSNISNPSVPSRVDPTGLQIPFLETKGFFQNYEFFSPYRQRLRSLLAYDMNNESCCHPTLRPYANETVLHLRGFTVQMRRGATLGFAELDPLRIANDLLGHLNPLKDAVAIVSLFDRVDPFVEALEQRGFQVRTITTGSSPHDFCFLLRANAVAGIAKSTFFAWAGLLGDQQRIDPYVFRSADQLKHYVSAKHQKQYMWTNETSDARLHLHWFDSTKPSGNDG